MDDTAIRVSGLGKQYHIGAHRGSHKTFRETLVDVMTAPFRRARSVLRGEAAGGPVDSFWALKDVSFNVIRGDVVGIIGRNGAGKSTLLKILSRITEPTMGEVRMRGRVGALLEVGTGFHSELSGRDNIYLNGALLGMRRAEIQRKFEDIVEFAEVAKFIDTQVKHYSSGMYVRLAFAVAAHLEPEILIVDEVLAVGDIQFQKKCLGKMSEVAKGGRTVLFVSHNIGILRQLCASCMWLDQGKLLAHGPTKSIADRYVTEMLTSERQVVRFLEDPNKAFQLLECSTVNDRDQPCDVFSCDSPIKIDLQCRVRKAIPGLYGYMTLIKNPDGVTVLESDSFDRLPNIFDGLPEGLFRIRIEVPPRILGVGGYSVNLSFASPQAIQGFYVDLPEHTVTFSVVDDSSRRGNARNGYLSTLLPWKVMNAESAMPTVQK